MTTGAGAVEVQAPRVHDRRSGDRFISAILPPYMRGLPKVSEGLFGAVSAGFVATGDFKEALAGLQGEKASDLSASSIGQNDVVVGAGVPATKCSRSHWDQRRQLGGPGSFSGIEFDFGI